MAYCVISVCFSSAVAISSFRFCFSWLIFCNAFSYFSSSEAWDCVRLWHTETHIYLAKCLLWKMLHIMYLYPVYLQCKRYLLWPLKVRHGIFFMTQLFHHHVCAFTVWHLCKCARCIFHLFHGKLMETQYITYFRHIILFIIKYNTTNTGNTEETWGIFPK